VSRPLTLATAETRAVARLEEDCVELQASQDHQLERDAIEARQIARLVGLVERRYAADTDLVELAIWLAEHDTVENRGHVKQRHVARTIAGRIFWTHETAVSAGTDTAARQKGDPTPMVAHGAGGWPLGNEVA
jgi:hypothetical protein